MRRNEIKYRVIGNVVDKYLNGLYFKEIAADDSTVSYRITACNGIVLAAMAEYYIQTGQIRWLSIQTLESYLTCDNIRKRFFLPFHNIRTTWSDLFNSYVMHVFDQKIKNGELP